MRANGLVATLLLCGGVTMNASAQGMVSGRVFDDVTGCPLRGVSMTAVGSSARTTADAQGRYYLKGVPGSPFALLAALRGYVTQSVTNLVVADTSTRVDFSLVRADADTGRVKTRYPSAKCVLDRRDSSEVRR
jgi:Carboxypeptidase regulatory-like domain